jgi:hypothetical protein
VTGSESTDEDFVERRAKAASTMAGETGKKTYKLTSLGAYEKTGGKQKRSSDGYGQSQQQRNQI